MINTGFAGDGQNRNSANRRTQKEINSGRFKKIFGLKANRLSQQQRENRKIASDYNRVVDIPSGLILFIISIACALIWVFV
ncbi:MAG: hypothetical protein ACPGLV_04240 [Bacteroidia bacterium]